MASQGRKALSWLQVAGARVYEATSGRWRVALAGAELLGLSTLAFGQPVLDALERSTYAFSMTGVGGLDLVIFTALLLLVPPAVMLGVELLVGLVSHSARGWVHLGWIVALIALLCWQAVVHSGNDGHLARVIIPLAGVIAAAALYIRFEVARSLLRVLAFAAPIVAGLFLLSTPVRDFTLFASADVPEPSVESRTPVVLLLFDEFPLAALLNSHGKIDAKRFPNFAALAKESNWYRNALTVADTTEQAVPAILTGDFAEPNGVANYVDHPQNLFTLLGSSEPSNIAETATELCPPQHCARRSSLVDRLMPLLRVGVSTANDSFPANLGPRVGSKLDKWFPIEPTPTEQENRFLEGLEAPPGGSLNFLHIELPHIPWQYMPSGKRYSTRTSPYGISAETWSTSAGYPIQGLQRLTLQLQYADRALGRILDRLRSRGLYKRALVAVVADHGAAFIPGQSRRLLSDANAGWILHVPLFVKLPGQRSGRVLTRPARTIDLLPTIADVLGIRIPWPVDGSSLLGLPSSHPTDTYMRYRDEILHIPPATVRRGFLQAQVERNAFVGKGDVFTLGASMRELRRELNGAERLEISTPSIDYDPDSGVYPSLVTGSLLTAPPAGSDRLIATLNGRIVAVAENVDSGTAFTTLIPPSAFRPGANRLEIYAP